MNHRFAFLQNRPLEKLHIYNFSSPKNNSSLQEFMLTHISSPLLFAFSQKQLRITPFTLARNAILSRRNYFFFFFFDKNDIFIWIVLI
ncbi:unnamed protein product [Blepharisma stoltei]|uniref:Uncharacterized protein n=1 Tax=Blepharisma stoltei TaxID=1481888 RepID=A0AAU9K120_9CILI|nr:unnamed protein product [Blepharisma stoltei]